MYNLHVLPILYLILKKINTNSLGNKYNIFVENWFNSLIINTYSKINWVGTIYRWWLNSQAITIYKN